MDTSRAAPRVKNKAAAPIQISAEQLLREAVDRQEPGLQAPTQRFADIEELHEHQGRKRTEFENHVRRNRLNLSNWTRYAMWELEQKEFRRARSVFERALDVDPNQVPLWLKYIEAEMKNRNINHARNLLDRAVTLLPRVDKLWYKYVYMEETLSNIPGTRQVFERWMTWEPDEAAWSAYIKMEKRYGEYDRARSIFERFTIVHPEPRNWLKWTRFEEENGTSDLVRDVFGMAIESLGEDFMDEKVFIAYARFESSLKEYERARAIYKFALDRMPRSRAAALQKHYTTFEKQHGDTEAVEDVVFAKRRVMYEEQVKGNPRNYDAWFDYARLEESSGDVERTRDVYERAIAQLPPTQEKRHWRRYIYLWIFYALWEEMENKDAERAGQVYSECLKLIPHSKFTFTKIWLLKAQFEIRQMKLQQARKTLGQAIGRCPKDSLFRGYIDLEVKLLEFVRCRTLYEKHVEWNPANCQAWIKFAELERDLDDRDRARAIFELAVSQQQLDMPELLWKAYIDFEEDSAYNDPDNVGGDFSNARALYERLLAKTDHVKVWISFAQFEINIPDEGEQADEDDDQERPVSEAAKTRARAVFTRAYKTFKDKDLKDEVCHATLLERQKTNIHSESHYSMHGRHSSSNTAKRWTSKRSRNRCHAESKRDGRLQKTSTRNTWTMCSQPTTRVPPNYQSCWPWRRPGRNSKLPRRKLQVPKSTQRPRPGHRLPSRSKQETTRNRQKTTKRQQSNHLQLMNDDNCLRRYVWRVSGISDGKTVVVYRQK